VRREAPANVEPFRIAANVSAETTKGERSRGLTPMTTRDQPPSLWTIAGVIGAAVLSAAGAAI
jgi:TPP-dependent pyruvate/acetoin dehydrogenase alpha subunit